MSVKKYFSDYKNVVRAQKIMLDKYGSDCLYGFFYAAIETEAMGGEVIYLEEGPPNAGEPVLKSGRDIQNFNFPPVKQAPCLVKTLKAIEGLKDIAGDSIPIIGVVMSPFSLPAMQMGFSEYLDLILEDKRMFDVLIKKNSDFCVEWANAQLDAGASAIAYIDPLSSPSILPRELFLETGHIIAKNVIARINGPVAMHLASGRTLSVIEDIVDTKAAAIGVSELDDMKSLKQKSAGKISLIGNLNGIKLASMDGASAAAEVKKIIDAAAKGGGLIISDNHGEIPWHVSEDVLASIRGAVDEWGRYF